MLSDHGQTQGATFRQRNGYGLDELVERHLEQRGVLAPSAAATRTRPPSAARSTRRPAVSATKARKRRKNDVSGRDAVVLGSGNLGLVYLMEEPRRLTLEEIEERHPRLIGALREHPHIGWLLVRSAAPRPASSLGRDGVRGCRRARSRATTRSRRSRRPPPEHLLRTDGFEHVADIMVGSFYDPVLDEGCAFEELISFHGGLGGPQTRPFVLHPVDAAGARRADRRRRAPARAPGRLARRAGRGPAGRGHHHGEAR